MEYREPLRLSEFTLGRPYHAALCQVSSRSTTNVHTHQNFYELVYILEGAGEHRLSTGCQPLRAGDLVLVRPSDWHYLAGLPPHGLEWINVAVPLAVWHGALDLVEVNSAGEWHRSDLPKVVSLSGEAATRLESSFREALERWTFNPTRLDLLRFVLDVLEVLSDRAEPDEGSFRPDWLVRACAAMSREENLRGGVGRLQELAAVSPGHLSRSIRTHYGVTPTTLVADLRLRHAELLLATTSLALTEIADRCGFASSSYFSRCFHSTQGVSPRDFRRQTRQAVVP